ncbi:MAG: DUF935 family protein, partial [Aliivibrio sp.]|uniref:phage portal protein family protein n=1 Tax=Aliivibrio sp. TaxID=1872443 RepID=UPI001A4F6737|nr:DUF935 family protein [Aliivibrio sp.]
SEKPFAYMMEFMDKTISKAILGGTLTSQADGKSSTNALGNVHNEVRQELRDSDLTQIAATLSRDLVLPMYMLNGKSYSKASRSPRFEFDITESEDLKAFSDALPNLVDVGFKIPVRWVHEKLQIPEAKDGEEVLTSASPVGRDLSRQATQTNALKGNLQAITKIAALKAKSVAPDQVDALTTQLGDNMSPVLQGFTNQVQQLVEQASSLEDLQQQLAELNIDVNEASDVMQQALVVAELGGRFDVNQESK